MAGLDTPSSLPEPAPPISTPTHAMLKLHGPQQVFDHNCPGAEKHLPAVVKVNDLKSFPEAICASLHLLTGVKYAHMQYVKGREQLLGKMPWSSTASWNRITHRTMCLLEALP